jgi:hypothetical protein
VSTIGNLKPENEFYDAAPVEPHLIYQGEVLVDVPLLLVQKDKRWLLLRTNSGRTIHEALKDGGIGGTVKVLDSNQTEAKWRNAIDGDSVVAYLTKRPVLVLSQTCDCENKDFIHVAPIYAADPEDIGKLKAGKDVYSAFYLESHPPHIPAASFADLERMQAIHKSYINRLDLAQHFRLKDKHVRNLQRHITRYFGRPNSFDSRVDVVPRTDTYLCIECFYFDGVATAVTFEEGAPFRECEKCHGVKWVRKGP